MAARLSIPVASTSGRLARGRTFSTSSYALVSSKTRPAPASSDPQISTGSESKSSEVPLDLFRDPPIPETSESKSLYQNSRPPPRRPGVKPPPTLALPSSMLPPPPRIPIPTSIRGVDGLEMSEAHGKTFSIYMNSLNKRDDEPTLVDLDALRPPSSTIIAALQGVIGSGRALLKEDHPLHLAIEKLGAQEATVGGGPKAKRTVVAGSKKAKKLEYQALYAATEGMIARGFTVAQLKRFEKETKKEKGHKKIELPPGKTTSKPQLIHSLMNKRWAMIHPKVLEDQIDSERKPIERSYYVSPPELFIFLGRDGEDLLHLSKELQMRINVDRQSSDLPANSHELSRADRPTTRPGFVIRASGTKSNHDKLRKHIENQRDAMIIRVVTLPTGPSLAPSLLQSISRIAGAFVENLDPKFASLNEDGDSVTSVSITAHSPRSAYTAERLVIRAAMEAAHRSQLSIFALLNAEKSSIPTTDEGQDFSYPDNQYALYPFGTQGFRMREVQWADTNSQYSTSEGNIQLPLTTGSVDIQKYDKDDTFILTGEESTEPKSHTARKLFARNVRGEVIDLSEHIFGKTSGEGERIVTATFGHVVFKPGKTTIIDPPLPKPASSNSILEWVNKQESTARTFIPGQVPSANLPTNVLSVHRLQYRTIEGDHIINVDVELPGGDVEPSAEQISSLGAASEDNSIADRAESVPTDRSSLESVDENHPLSSQPKNTPEPIESPTLDFDSLTERTTDPASKYPPTEEESGASDFTPLPVEIAVGTETAFELMLPESTMDIYVNVSNTTPVAKPMIPEALDIYLDGLSKFFTTDIEMPQPDPPQYLNFDGRYYILVKNTSARSGKSAIADLPLECTVTSELSLDLENNVRTAFTQLIYPTEGLNNDWDNFIGACQTLASKPYERSTELRVSPT